MIFILTLRQAQGERTNYIQCINPVRGELLAVHGEPVEPQRV